MDADDIGWMREALALARRGVGRTRPNPPVGAVVVRDGRVVGRGFHRRAGMAHAEVEALRDAGGAAAGATLYVTLEPCSSWGRTGPCTEAIVAAGIRRVVVAARDPNPKHAGRGFRILRRAGVAVATGVLAAEGRELLAPFSRWVETGLPWVTLKLGMSVDGRLADATGRSQWITSPASRARVQDMRRTADAIIVGVGTALADDPSLTCRRYPASKPWRVIVDSRGRLPLKARVLTDGAAGRT
jgi:diaminohydroxyphosphoribosylaminopyrimidine deaminase/5-amino-6-(5-phosphoribosylamino)uracil reductase